MGKEKIRRIISTIMLSVTLVVISILIFYQNFPDYYSEWLSATPSYHNEKVTESTTSKKEIYDVNFNPPRTNAEKMQGLLSDNLNDQKYLATIMTKDQHLNVNIYDGISNRIFNTGNAGAYPGFDLEKNVNSTAAAHTYSGSSWQDYSGFTMIQIELNKGDKFYVSNGSSYYEYEVFDKQKIPAKNGGYITKTDRADDKKVNPSGKPMMTLYDCWEPEDGSYLDNPPDRNIILASQINKYDKNNVPRDISSLFGSKPRYVYDKKTKQVILKDASRKGNSKLKFYDFLFGQLKVQNLMSIITKIFNKVV